METRSPARSFGVEHFGTADLGDERRTRRLARVADEMLKNPGGTSPDKLNQPKDLKAFYRLMNNRPVTHGAVLAPHAARTLEQMSARADVVLILHDKTELDYSGLTSVEGLGQIGNGNGRGYECMNSLAVTEQREVLGLVHQILFNRPHVPKGQTRDQRRRRPNRESRLWTQASTAIPPAPSGHLWVDVADREADLLEFLDSEERLGKKYVVRSKHNRRIFLEKDGESAPQLLHDLARSLPVVGHRLVSVQAREDQPARTAQVAIAWEKVAIRPPVQPRGEYRATPLTIWVVRVGEIEAPVGVEEPLEWILVTNVAVENLHDAGERIDWYSCRWVIEEFHKALKTGCNVESLQFTTQGALQPTIALLSVLAVSLLNLRDASRRPDAKERPATEVVSPLLVEVLSRWRQGVPMMAWSVHDFYLALGRLGGHQNRKSDHPPGWLVLWRGWTKLQFMAEAVATSRSEKCGQT